MSEFWSWYIIVLVLGSIIGFAVLLLVTRKVKSSMQNERNTTGHSFDGIEEFNNPLPRWWLWLFWITIIFALVYLALYPGLGNFAGYFGWTSTGQHREEIARADAIYKPIFEEYAKQPIDVLIHNQEAMQSGQRLFANNCATCHGVDARGGIGFPDLTDNDWLYGGSPEAIATSIREGRSGMMPAFDKIFREDSLLQVINYLFSLSNREHDAALVDAGKQKFIANCAVCHGENAQGNQQMGAPNLADDIWLYGGSVNRIKYTLINGRNGKMPAHKLILSPEEIHVLAAYVYSLSKKNTQE